jgi:hypothetical protein
VPAVHPGPAGHMPAVGAGEHSPARGLRGDDHSSLRQLVVGEASGMNASDPPAVSAPVLTRSGRERLSAPAGDEYPVSAQPLTTDTGERPVHGAALLAERFAPDHRANRAHDDEVRRALVATARDGRGEQKWRV